MYSDSVLYAVSLFGWYIVLLLSVHVSVGVYCTDSGLCGLFSPPQKTANTVPLHTYQRMFFASAIAATDKYLLLEVLLWRKLTFSRSLLPGADLTALLASRPESARGPVLPAQD